MKKPPTLAGRGFSQRCLVDLNLRLVSAVLLKVIVLQEGFNDGVIAGATRQTPVNLKLSEEELESDAPVDLLDTVVGHTIDSVYEQAPGLVALNVAIECVPQPGPQVLDTAIVSLDILAEFLDTDTKRGDIVLEVIDLLVPLIELVSHVCDIQYVAVQFGPTVTAVTCVPPLEEPVVLRGQCYGTAITVPGVASRCFIHGVAHFLATATPAVASAYILPHP